MRLASCLLPLALLLTLESSAAGSEELVPSPQAVARSPKSISKKPRLKLTLQQEHGLSLLQSAEAQASAAEPEMRAYLLRQISNGYSKSNPRKARLLLENAFHASLAVSSAQSEPCVVKDETCRVRQSLQRDTLHQLMWKYPEEAEQLAEGADPSVRSEVNSELVEHFLEKKEYRKAEGVLNRLADSADYPYDSATELVQALPESHKSERLVIFAQALTTYEQNPPDPAWVTPDDFAGMLTHLWRELPPPTALEAADAVLDQAKNAKDESSTGRMAIQTFQDETRFSSLYELRLFEVLPILKELDSSRAEALQREHESVKSALTRYPQGLNSIPPVKRETSDGKSEDTSGIVNFGPTLPDAAAEDEQVYVFATSARISEECSKDLRQALADALGLPQVTPKGYHPQFSALRTVSKMAAIREPQVAREAIAGIRKQIDGLRPLWAVVALLEAGETYLKMGDKDGATSVLADAMRWVDKLYDEDSDQDNPNLAFKGNWPSVAMWGRCIGLATKISSDRAERLIEEISDPEIAALEKIAYANALLGVGRTSSTVVMKHKEKPFEMMSF